MTITRRPFAFWGITGTFAALMVFSGILYLTGAPMIRETLAHLGYPGYLLGILGVAKLAGVVGLLQNRAPILREWAYAGFTIDLLGATASHVLSGDPLGVAAVPALFLVWLAASYALQPEGHVVIRTNRDDRRVPLAA